MSNYAVITVSNGTFSISSEHDDKESAIVSFLNTSAALHNAPDVELAAIRIVDRNLDTVDGRMDFIDHVG